MYPVAELDGVESAGVGLFPGLLERSICFPKSSERLLNTSWISEGRIGLGLERTGLAGESRRDIAGMGGALGLPPDGLSLASTMSQAFKPRLRMNSDTS